MRRLFVLGALLLALFEVANVYFIMPLPGSQRLRSLDLAYAVYRARWIVRSLALLLMLAGLAAAWRAPRFRWLVAMPLAGAVGALAWFTNMRMAADRIFLPPTVQRLAGAAENGVALDRLVVGIEVNGSARAYPLQVIGYHHQLRDSVAGETVLVTYCTVCRTGRVFRPTVAGQDEQFRLVGMDRFNAMLEDVRTRSWWRQANGEAVAGPRRGARLEEIPSRQVTLRQWLALYPQSLVLQPDPAFAAEYGKDYAYERGTSRKALTGTDTSSWGEKSWVVGVTIGGASRAYDWNHLERARVINDVLGGTPIVVALASDSISFVAFERPDRTTAFRVDGDSLLGGGVRYAMNGQSAARRLVAINASQEFWHSWRTFQPATDQYPAPSPEAGVRSADVHPDETPIARTAVQALFEQRERAQAITLWHDTTTSLTLGLLTAADASPLVRIGAPSLAPSLRYRMATLDTMEAFFRTHAAGWDAWFEANPGNAGLVEIARPVIRGREATIVVGRACGEQCRSAWRLSLTRDAATWRVQRIDVLAVPRG